MGAPVPPESSTYVRTPSTGFVAYDIVSLLRSGTLHAFLKTLHGHEKS
jgi:hypothetical protein